MTVPAGESASITLQARLKKEEKGKKGKVYGFQVRVTPAGAKMPSREVKTINGQLEYQRRREQRLREQRPLEQRRRGRPWKWILLGFAIVAVGIIFWSISEPRLNRMVGNDLLWVILWGIIFIACTAGAVILFKKARR